MGQVSESHAEEDPLRRLRNVAGHDAVNARRLRQLWGRWHYGIGITAIVSAAVAGVVGLKDLSDGTVIVSIAAFASAISSTTLTFLRPDVKQEKYDRAAAAWQSSWDLADREMQRHRNSSTPESLLLAQEHIEQHQAAIRTGDYSLATPVPYPG
jgi:hypothetical protein